MDKADFKLVYNLTKNFNQDKFKNILKKINNNSKTEINNLLTKYTKDDVIDVLNKIEKFYFKNNLDDMFSVESATSSDHISTPLNTNKDNIFMSGGSATSSDHMLDTTPALSQTSFNKSLNREYNDILDIEQEITRVNNLSKEQNIDTIDNLVNNFSKDIIDTTLTLETIESDKKLSEIAEDTQKLLGQINQKYNHSSILNFL